MGCMDPAISLAATVCLALYPTPPYRITEEFVGVEVRDARLRGPGQGRDTSTGSFFQAGGLGDAEYSPDPAFNTHTSASRGRGGVGWEVEEEEEEEEKELCVPPSTSDPGETPPKRKMVVVQG